MNNSGPADAGITWTKLGAPASSLGKRAASAGGSGPGKQASRTIF